MESKEDKEPRTTTSSSFRKPLTDVSNNKNRHVGRPSKREATRNPIGAKRGEDGAVSSPRGGNGSEDRLLDQLSDIRSNLSSLTRQIDELVAQAVDSKGGSGEGRVEIERFAHFLSDMVSSLQPWVPRFQEAISRPPSGTGDQSEQCFADQSVDGSPQGQDSIMDSLVSPSPLVSWRENDKVEHVKRFTLNPDVEVPSFLAISQEANDDLLEGAAMDQTPGKPLDSVVVMTPCPKLPPPESSVLPEPASILFHKFDYKARKCTPFPAGMRYSVSDSSSGGSSDDLGLMYPELVGIRRAYMPATGKEKIEASPEWLISALKTRFLPEPIDHVLNDVTMDHHPLPNSSPVINEQPVQSLKHVQEALENIKLTNTAECSTIVESTPVWKEPASTMRRGKHPGESTLKKELWTKFEAASTYGLRLQGTAKRGFMDMLDEVSCDEEGPSGDGSK